ncbi:MAG: TRAP transporter substrate-binding protein DctP [Acidobacteriota bacterium]
MTSMFRCLTVASLLLLTLPPVADARSTVIKMASLAPDGSVWDQFLRDMGAEWQESTDGKVRLRLYPGGVAGDESDIVRKMRVGQLHAAALSVGGLEAIDESFKIFSIPMFFAAYDELYHVLDQLRPEFEKRLDAKGYVLLHWGNGGWVHLFSKQPIRTVDDLRRQKIFTGTGDSDSAALWRKNEFQTVALATTDLLTSLQTGMVDVVPTTPLAALSLQWFRHTPYMQDLGLAPLVGATVVTKRLWNRLDESSRDALRKAARETETQLFDEIPKRDEEAIEQMRGRGLTVVPVPDGGEAAWQDAAKLFADYRRANTADRALLDKIVETLETYRDAHAALEP